MSVKVSGKVWELDLDPTEKLVLLALADFANHEGNNVRPGNELLMAMTGLNERTIGLKIKRFLSQGILENSAGKTGRGHRREFSINPDRAERRSYFIKREARKVERTTTFPLANKVESDSTFTARKVESDDSERSNPTARKVESDDIAYKEVTVSKPSEENRQQQQQQSAAEKQIAAAAKFAAEAHASKFSFEEIAAYVEATKPHARNPGGLARALYRSGEEDQAIEKWQQQQRHESAAPIAKTDERAGARQSIEKQLTGDQFGGFALAIQQSAEAIRRKPKSRWTIYEQEVVEKAEELSKQEAA
jgi:hypothetical protein